MYCAADLEWNGEEVHTLMNGKLWMWQKMVLRIYTQDMNEMQC